MTVAARPRPLRARNSGDGMHRLLFWLVLALAVGVLVFAALRFLWPTNRQPDLLLAGMPDDFTPGSVTAFALVEKSRLARMNVTAMPQPLSNDSMQTQIIYLVRLATGELLALYAKSPHLGCTVRWLPDFEYEGSGKKGWFRDPCFGSTWDITGHRVFGPTPRDLDRYEVLVRDGQVIVDISRLIPGEPIPQVRGDATPARMATPPPELPVR